MTSVKEQNIKLVPVKDLILRIFRIKKQLLKEIEVFHKEHGDVFALNLESLKCFVREPKLIKHILVDNSANYEKGKGFKFFHDVIGFGLLTSDGEKWKSERKVLNQEFTRNHQQRTIEIFKEELSDLQRKWEDQSEVNFTKDINLLTMKTICRIVFDIKLPSNSDDVRQWFCDYDDFIGHQQKLLIKPPLWLPLPYLIRRKRAKAGLRKFANEIMVKSLESERENVVKRMAENNFTDENIKDHILTLFIAGHETTANSINFTFLLLRDNPDYIEKLRKEINTLEDITSSELLDLIIKESLRLYPTIPLFPRVALDEDKFEGYTFKKGDMIAFCPWSIHRSEKYWENALKFIPERFKETNFERKFTYFPFGAGPRKCIGAAMSTIQMKYIISFIIKNFDFKIEGPSLDNIKHNVSLSPKGDCWLKELHSKVD